LEQIGSNKKGMRRKNGAGFKSYSSEFETRVQKEKGRGGERENTEEEEEKEPATDRRKGPKRKRKFQSVTHLSMSLNEHPGHFLRRNKEKIWELRLRGRNDRSGKEGKEGEKRGLGDDRGGGNGERTGGVLKKIASPNL